MAEPITRKTEEEIFQNFIVLVYEPNPLRDGVKLMIDDEPMMFLKRDRFINLLQGVLDTSNPIIRESFAKIEMSIYEYGGWFEYDRDENVFRELRAEVVEERLDLAQVRQDLQKTNNVSYVATPDVERYNQVLNQGVRQGVKEKRFQFKPPIKRIY